MNNFMILYDHVSKKMIKNNIMDLTQQGAIFINSLVEITEEIVKQTRTCIVLEGIMRLPNIVSQLKLYKNLLGLEFIYIGDDSFWYSSVKDLVRIYECGIEYLDIKIITAALYNDNAYKTDPVSNKHFRTALDDVNLIKKHSDLYTKEVVELADTYSFLYGIVEEYKNKIAELEQKNSELEKQCALFERENQKYLRGYASILEDTRKLNKTLLQYESIITKDIYDKVILSNYPNRPKIVYLKEFELVDHFFTLISILFDMVKLQCKMSVKVVILYDSKTSRRLQMLPSYYKIIHNSFTNSDVIANDFIAKSGNYLEIFDLLLSNKSSLDLLLVVDCKSVQDIVLSGSMIQLPICKSPKYFETFSLLPSMTISGDSESELYWGKFKELDKIEHDEDKFLFLSSRPVCQKIYKLIDSSDIAI